MGYSDNEIDEAAGSLTQGALSFSNDNLGPRDVQSTFNEIRELISAVFLYQPDSIFYLFSLNARALRRLVYAEIESVDSLLGVVEDMAIPDRSIADISHVTTARITLGAVEDAVSRGGDIRESAQYAGYQVAMRRALNLLGSQVKSSRMSGATSTRVIVHTGSEARELALVHLGDLETKHDATLALVDQLLVADSEFQATGLVDIVSRKLTDRAHEALVNLELSLEGMTSIERSRAARSSLLTLLSNQALVGRVAEQKGHREPRLLQARGGVAACRLIGAGTGMGATVTGQKSGPFKLVDGSISTLELDVNGVFSGTIDLLSTTSDVKQASLLAGRKGPFVLQEDRSNPGALLTRRITIGMSYSVPVGLNRLHLSVDDIVYEIALPTGPLTAVALVSQIGAIPTVTATVVVDGGQEYVSILYANSSPPAQYHLRNLRLFRGAGNADCLGPYTVSVGGTEYTPTDQYSVRLSGASANNVLRIRANSETPLDVTLPVGTFDNDFEVTEIAVRDAIIAAGGTSFTADRYDPGSGEQLRILSLEYGEGSSLVLESSGIGSATLLCLLELGFYSGQASRQNDVGIQAVISAINSATGFSDQAVALANREEHFRSQTAYPDATLNVFHVALTADPTSEWPALALIKVEILNGNNAGVYSVSSALWVSGTLSIKVGRGFVDHDVSHPHELVVYRSWIEITSSDQTVESSISITGGTAGTEIGLQPQSVIGTVRVLQAQRNDPRLSWIPKSLRGLSILAGDLIRVLATDQVIASVVLADETTGLITIDQYLPNDTLLDNTDGFEIVSLSESLYSDFEDQLSTWRSLLVDSDFVALGNRIRRLAQIVPTQVDVDAVVVLINNFRDQLTNTSALLQICDQFMVPTVSALDDCLQLLLEHGYDRARSLLLGGQIEAYYEITAHTASFARALMDAASEVGVHIVNEPLNVVDDFEDTERLVGEYESDLGVAEDFTDMESEPDDPEAWDSLENF